MIVRADVLVMTVLHSEAARNGSELFESKTFIQVSGMRIALNDSVELQNPEAVFCTLFQAVQNEFLTDVLTAEFGTYGIACVADVSASADIVRVEDIETGDITVDLCNTRICLRFEECLPGSHIKKLFLRKSDSFFNDLIPDGDHGGKVFIFKFADSHRSFLLKFSTGHIILFGIAGSR